MKIKSANLRRIIPLIVIGALVYGIYWHSQQKIFLYHDKKETFDLDQNGALEKYDLIQGQLTISSKNQTLWQSPKDWTIDHFILADSNNDGIIDLNMSVWKPGNFGDHKPFWIKENDTSIKNHFFIFDFIHGKFIPKWQSSNLTEPNCSFEIRDTDNDGKNDLIAHEGEYEENTNAPINQCTSQKTSVWKWNDWGFSKEDGIILTIF